MADCTILIPTRNRPGMLEHCLKAALDQTMPPVEIIVGDDSDDDQAETVIARLQTKTGIPIRSQRNRPPLGQGGNVHSLVAAASSDLICLIHDDDWLTKGALMELVPRLSAPETIIAFGCQGLAMDGETITPEASRELNARYHRTETEAGPITNLLESAITQQLPNNGFVVRRDVALKADYAECQRRFGDACDFGFAVRLAQQNPDGQAWFSPVTTAVYRQEGDSVLRNNPRGDAAYQAFRYVFNLPADQTGTPAIRRWLQQNAPIAIGNALSLGDRKSTRRWSLSRWNRRALLTPGGLKRLARAFLGT